MICSPLTLFAFLGVIRQAYDNFVVEQTSDQILALIDDLHVSGITTITITMINTIVKRSVNTNPIT